MTNFLQDTDSHSWPDSGFHFEDFTTSAEEHTNAFRLRGESNPTRQARDILLKIENPSVAEQLGKLLLIIDKTLDIVRQRADDSSRIPLLRPHIDEDGSILLEWVFSDFRIGFNIEPNPEDSGWHLVSNKRLSESIESKQLINNMNELVFKSIDFIIKNT